MLNRLILILFIGLVYGDGDKITNPLLKELNAYADSLSLEIPLGSSVYIADHTDFGGLSSYFGGFVADQVFEHLSTNDDFTILDKKSLLLADESLNITKDIMSILNNKLKSINLN